MTKSRLLLPAIMLLSVFGFTGLQAHANASDLTGSTDLKKVESSVNSSDWFCLQSTKAILNSSKWKEIQKAEVQDWLLQVQHLIVNSADFQIMQKEMQSSSSLSKSTYAFCLDSAGKAVGFHVLNRENFSPFDERISAIVEACGPFPAAPNHLPWSEGGMRVELTLFKEFKISIAPDWPNARLASVSEKSL